MTVQVPHFVCIHINMIAELLKQSIIALSKFSYLPLTSYLSGALFGK